MAKWVLQSKVPSASKSARTRVAYLDSIVPEVKSIIEGYFAAYPEGQDVTLEVLQRLGRDRLVLLAGGEEHLDRIKQDVGRLVPLCLVDMFGPHRVLTFREDNEKAVSTRAVRRAGMEWVARFTPHRLLANVTTDRIVLDTCILRNLVQGSTPDGLLDLEELARIKGEHRVSLADAAWAEVMAALLRPTGGISFGEWQRLADALTTVLDPELPIVPGGFQLVSFSGLLWPHTDSREQASHLQAVWKFTSTAKSRDDLAGTYEFDSPSGQRIRIGPLDDKLPRQELQNRWRSWEAYIDRVRSLKDTFTLEEAVGLIKADLATGLPARAVDRLDLLVHAVAVHIVRAAHPKQSYAYDQNDTVDLDVLFSTVLPAVVCSADGKLLTLARHCESSDGWRVKSPHELLRWLSDK